MFLEVHGKQFRSFFAYQRLCTFRYLVARLADDARALQGARALKPTPSVHVADISLRDSEHMRQTPAEYCGDLLMVSSHFHETFPSAGNVKPVWHGSVIYWVVFTSLRDLYVNYAY